MILLNDYDSFSDIMVVPLDFFWIWVEVCDLPVALTTNATLRLVGETIRPILNVDQAGLRRGSTRVCVTLPLNSPVRMDRRPCMSPNYVIKVQYMYERLVGLCKVLNHGGLSSPNAQDIEEGTGAPIGPVAAPTFPSMVFRAKSQIALVVPILPALYRVKRTVQIKEVASLPSSVKVTGVIRNQEEDETEGEKRMKHTLAMVPLDLNLGVGSVMFGSVFP
ncbi:hypothetical protein ACLB2K_041518 [Fragaria x ananassa]